MCFEAVEAIGCLSRGQFPSPPFPGIAYASCTLNERNHQVMSKSLDAITEIIRNPKHPFRKADDRPIKAQKNRYERRKIKEFIKLGDWAGENAS